jgi:hypothetical protein
MERDRRYRLRWSLGVLLVLGCAPLGGADSDGLQCAELLELAGRVHSRDAVELPTIVLVGHKNDGKSSLFEALLGLKLTHVGHDATTRRPLRVHAQRDETAAEPVLYLVRNGQEESMRLEDIQAYLQSENVRLEEAGTYEAEPVHVRLLWKRATTCVLIDTPGLIGDTQSEELGTLRDYVEQIVAEQMKPAKRLILCLEDTSDWALVRTMGAVSQVDPELKRTILVATKLDTKMAQVMLARTGAPARSRSRCYSPNGLPACTKRPAARPTPISARERAASARALSPVCPPEGSSAAVR